jgi:hypothetical protein
MQRDLILLGDQLALLDAQVHQRAPSQRCAIELEP